MSNGSAGSVVEAKDVFAKLEGTGPTHVTIPLFIISKAGKSIWFSINSSFQALLEFNAQSLVFLVECPRYAHAG